MLSLSPPHTVVTSPFELTPSLRHQLSPFWVTPSPFTDDALFE